MNGSRFVARGRGLAVVALLLAMLFWAANFLIGETAVRSIDPLSLNFWRWALAAPLLVGLAIAIERPDGRTIARALPRLAVLGVLGMIGFSLSLYIALETTSAVSASLVSAVSPVLIAITATIALRERLHALVAIGLVLGLIGVVTVVTEGSLAVLAGLTLAPGDLWILLAVVCWSAYTVAGRSASAIPPITTIAVQAATATIIQAPFLAVFGLDLPETGSEWGSLAFIVLLTSMAAYLLWNLALRAIPTSTAGIFLNVIPVYTVILAVIFGQPITGSDLVGGALVLAGVLLATLRVRPRATPGAPA